MRHRMLALTLTVATVAAACGSSRSADATLAPLSASGAVSAWPGALHDARHSGEAGAGVVGPQSGAVRWSRRLEGAVSQGPAVEVDGTVLASSNGGVLHDLDPASGTDRWTFEAHATTGTDLSTTPTVLAGGTVLWPGPGDTLYALTASGTLLWSEHFAGPVLSPAARNDRRVYVTDGSGHLTALDVTPTGHRPAWVVRIGGASYGSPVIAPDGTVVTTTDRAVVAVHDAGDRASVAWRWPSPAVIEVSPGVAADGTVVVGPNDDWAYGIAPGGRLRWKWRKGDWSYSSAAVTADGTAWFGDHLGFLDELVAATGQPVRRLGTIPHTEPHPGGVGVWTAPAIDSRHDVYFGTVVGHVYGFDWQGHRLFDVLTGGAVESYPALGPDGTLYIGSSDGRVYAIGH